MDRDRGLEISDPGSAWAQRSAPLQATLAAAQAIAPLAGVTRVADIGGLDNLGLEVAAVIRPNSRSLSLTSGKGLSFDEACVSGLMEALELYHAETFQRWIPLGELPADLEMADIDHLPRTAASRFPRANVFRVTIGTDLVTSTPVAVPFDLVHADFRTLSEPSKSGFPVSSNGLGGGNCREEAIFQGLCEVIEGDAVALLRAKGENAYDRIAWPTVEDEIVVRLYEACLRRDVDAFAWNITTEIGVPAYYCRLLERASRSPAVAIATDGAGCHPIPAVALRRALMEAMQTRVLLISGARDDIRPGHYEETTPRPRGVERSFSRDCDRPVGPIGRSIDWIIAKLAQAGFDRAIVVDLGCHSQLLAFVRVIVPGLEGFPHSRGYRPGPRARSATITA